MPQFTADELVRTAADIFTAAGASPENARIVAELLADANSTGHDSHGLIRIPPVPGRRRKGRGGLRCRGRGPEGKQAHGDRRRTLGIRSGDHEQGGGGRTPQGGRERHGRRRGARRQPHWTPGKLCRTDRAPGNDRIGLFVNAVGTPAYRMAPWGGTEPRLVTDPLAVGIPSATGEPIVVDMTTTVVAEGKVRLRRNRGEKTPDGWLLDSEGKPTNDPNMLYGDPPGQHPAPGGSRGRPQGLRTQRSHRAFGRGC